MIEFITPMLLKNCPLPFDSADFLFEFKFDGVRSVLDLREEPIIYNRHGKIKTHLYPEITAAARLIDKGVVLDGEIIAVDENGRQSFYSVLERDLAKKYSPKNSARVFYTAFDILYINGESVMDKPLTERKALLNSALKNCLNGGVIRPVDYYSGEGKMLYDAADGAGLEGIVAKKADSAYKPGTRGDDWQKIKCFRYIDAFVLGYTKTQSRISLLLGVKTDGGYRYVGNVSNGLKAKEFAALKNILDGCEADGCRLSAYNEKAGKDTVFTEPVIKLKVKYLEQDDGGKLRQPVIERIY